MADELLAGSAALVGVMGAGIDERLLDAVPVDRKGGVVRVLLDDREQVAEEAPLDGVQLRTLDDRLGTGVFDPVDRRARGRDQRARAAAARRLLGGRFALLLRNRWPSSYRLA
jgi:hypothetical protein